MKFAAKMSPEQENALQACLQLAQTLEYEEGHTHQVTRLALRLFDELQALHQLGETERFWLQCAGILHDIGWVEGWKGHHKTALRIIQTTQLLPFESKERLIIGSIARYHRKALPSLNQDHFAALEPDEQEKVKTLSAILRTADGLDAAHQSRVRDLMVHVSKKKIVIHCAIKTLTAIEEETAAIEKSDLLGIVFQRAISFRWKSLI
ncbi:exopolyphosphatase [Longilinea arvoryzae]|uniref:Exopolyphosphatase n=1 Tax=Longilinea arvoryzae TaxID=360412 RepID=A0A0S7BN56_9CHLR|nr:HD domain-containing protein [Longilinea arvoryzae]GAP15253.1 exopolyphosphatase [Longilinea arvoryzae]